MRAREEEPKRGERGEDEERPPGADIRLDEVDALAPIREVERHERGGREAVPHDAVVGDLRERDQEGGDVEQPHESRDDARVADAEKRGGKRGKQDDFCRADEEVVANFRSVPVLCVRPRVEQRERHAPRDPRDEIRRHGEGEERHARRVRQQRERRDDGHERRHEVACAHVLPDIDIEGDEADEVNACRRQPADDIVLARSGNRHVIPRFFPS